MTIVNTTRKDALFRVDRAMVRIRRSQSRRSVGRLMRQKLGPHLNLTGIAVADALQELTEAGIQNPTIGEMAAGLGIEPSRASRMTADAIRGGLVRRIASQSDGRSSNLELTKKGMKALQTTQRFRLMFFAQLMSGWSDRECAQFAKLLIRFTDALPNVFGSKRAHEGRGMPRPKGPQKSKGRSQ